jgi:hypothetical protein
LFRYLYINSANNTNVDVLELHPGGKSQQIQSFNFAQYGNANLTIDKYFLDGMATYFL